MIKVSEQQGVLHISVHGFCRIEGDNVNGLWDSILPYLKPKKQIVLSFEKVLLIDTQGFNMLLSVKETLENRGGTFKMAHISDNLKDMFRLMGMQNDFEWVQAHTAVPLENM
jgi:anti-anti-sigma factor